MNADRFDCLKLGNQLCFPLYACSKEIVKRYKPFLDEIDLTYTQYIAMLALWENKEMTVKELAEHSGTVPSAVVRFCKSIGATGFSDFKICLSAGLGKKASAAEMLPVGEGDEPKQVFSKVFASGINTLQDTLSMIDFSQTETIVRLLQKATRIVFFGVGTSSVIATDAQYRFAQLGIATSACTDILFMNVTAVLVLFTICSILCPADSRTIFQPPSPICISHFILRLLAKMVFFLKCR